MFFFTVPQEFGVDKTHLLLPTETNTVLSDNETFEDCSDDRDPLSATYAESSELYATTELESYRSAVNNMNGTHNETMENICDMTLETESQSLQTQVVQASQPEHNQQSEFAQEDEPMDVDMNATMEIIQETSNNIQHVEQVLQHAENILQHIEEKKSIQDLTAENATVDENVIQTNQNGETEQPQQELCLSKTVKFSTTANNLGSEGLVEANNNADSNEDNIKLQSSETELKNNTSLSACSLNTSIISNSSTQSTGNTKVDGKLNLTLNIDNSMISQKSLSPSSPSFPIKHTQNEGFPRSPKALANKHPQPPFLEKSNFATNSSNSLNGTLVEPCTKSNQSNDTFVQPIENGSSLKQNIIHTNKRLTFGVDTLNQELENKSAEHQSPTQELSTEFPAAVNTSIDKRLTFCVNETTEKFKTPIQMGRDGTTENDQSQASPVLNTQCPAVADNSIDKRDTFCANEKGVEQTKPTCPDEYEKPLTHNTKSMVAHESVDAAIISENTVSRRTFNVEAGEKEIEQNTSFEPMDVDDTVSQNTTMHGKDEPSQSPTEAVEQHTSQLPSLPAIQERSQSPSVPAIQPRSESPPIPTIQKQQSSWEQEKSQSPPLPTMQHQSQSPPLPAMKPHTPLIKPVKLSTLQEKTIDIKKEQTSPILENDCLASESSIKPQSQPLPVLIQKRPPIRNINLRSDILSAKEQNNIKVKDEKDVFVEKCTPSPAEDVVFTGISSTSTTLTANTSGFSEFNHTSPSSSSASMNNNEEQHHQKQQNFEEEFGGNNNSEYFFSCLNLL